MSDVVQKAIQDQLKDKALKEKEYALKESKISREFDKLEEARRQDEVFRKVDLSQMTDEYVNAIVSESRDYMEAAKNCQPFINNAFRGSVPMFRKNIIFIGAATGEGKSTVTANLALSTIKQGGKVLVLTNEEAVSDCYNRVTSLIKKWNYQNHEDFTDEQRNIFLEYIPKLSKRMVVYDDRSINLAEGGDTTTIEGIKGILENLIANQVHYDAVIIDYYQNVQFSKKNPGMAAWEVQEKLASYLDSFKNRYSGPIIVLGQIRPAHKDAEVAFEDRIKGRKQILVVSTCAIECRANKNESTTEWIFHKSRFGAKVLGSAIKTGWDRGQYVEYTADFQRMVEERKMNALLSSENAK